MIRPMTPRPIRRALVSLLALPAVLAPAGARADISLPAGFTATVYISGEGNNAASGGAGGVGMPSTSSLAVDHTGTLYLARSGRRYSGGEYEYLSPIYRVPPGGGRVTPQSEPRFFHGPPLNNAQVSADIGGRQVFVTTFDRDRRVGVVYRLIDGQMRLLAGGAPETGVAPMLVQPEGVAVNRAGQVFVADRERGVVVRVDAEGRVLDESFARVVRPRAIAIDEADHLWIGADSGAEAPWQPGPGQIWRVSPEGQARLGLERTGAPGLAPRHGRRDVRGRPPGRLHLRADARGRADHPRPLHPRRRSPRAHHRAGHAGDARGRPGRRSLPRRHPPRRVRTQRDHPNQRAARRSRVASSLISGRPPGQIFSTTRIRCKNYQPGAPLSR